MTESAVMRAAKITKVFPGTTALNQADFRVERGRINILIGENGAGKSTLMRILAGIEMPTSGELFFEERPLRLKSPADASRAGIAMVHQELSMMPNLTVAENIFAGREIRRGRIFVDEAAQRGKTAALLKQLNLDLPPDTRVAELAVGQRQLVEIARALGQNARVLILDEPTSALSAGEIGALFRVLRELKQKAVSIVYISHRLPELLEIGEHFTILRDGRVAATAARHEVSERWMVERITGRSHTDLRGSQSRKGDATPALTVKSLTVSKHGRTCLNNVSLQAAGGEILGIYGLLGAGRTELFETLAGLRRQESGHVLLRGEPLDGLTVSERLKQGLCLVPEDRQNDALIPDMAVRANTSLARVASFCRAGFISSKKETAQTAAMLERVKLKRCDHRLPITTLSGGNQQKSVVARALLTRPAVLLLDEPVRGVDAGAKAEIYELIRSLAAEGLCVLFASSDTQEIRELAHRVLVLCRGAFTADFKLAEAADEALLRAAGGTTCPN